MQLSGNTILITGGSSGIGLQLAKELLAKDNVVIVTGRDAKRLEAAKAQLPKVHTIQSDAASPSDVSALRDRVLREFPKLNVLFNNAGVMQELNFHREDLEDEELTREIAINLMGPIRLAKAFLPHLKRQQAAAIVNVTSGLAFVPLPTSPVYCATKAGMHSFSESLRVQLAHTSVRVFELAPPATATPLLDKHDPEAMKGVAIMPLESMVAACLAGMAKDKFEMRPGQANQLKVMSRIAPGFIGKMLAKSVDVMLKKGPR